MFGLIRLVVLCGVAFIAGVLYERHGAREACPPIGVWQNGMCFIQRGGQ